MLDLVAGSESAAMGLLSKRWLHKFIDDQNDYSTLTIQLCLVAIT